jgi:hypothetical protein
LARIVFCLALSLALGCGRPNSPNGTEAGAGSPSGPGDQTLPFHPNPDRASEADHAPSPIPADHQRDNSTPFHSLAAARSLPAGTLITIRMESSISTSHVSAGDPFSASVAGPLTVDGNTLVERGTPVSGRVESAQPPASRPGLRPDPGYVRLTLSALTLDGRAVALQTSSLFARGTFQSSAASVDAASKGQSDDFRVQKGRRLTFRLTAPVALTDPSSIANRQYSGLPNE